MSSTLGALFAFERRARTRIVALTLIATVIGAGYAFVQPKWYRSVLTVVPTMPQKAGLSAVLGSMSALAGGGEGGISADVGRIAAVLQSATVADAVIDKLDLRARYQQPVRENAREALWSHCDVKTISKAGLVELSCEDKDPQVAQQIVSAFADYGNQAFRRVSVSSASEEVRFLEKRVRDLRQQASDASDRMRAFQEEHRIVDLDTQARAVVSSLAALNNEKISKQLQLGYARSYSSNDEATMRQLRSQLSVVGDKLEDLEAPAPLPGPSKGDRSTIVQRDRKLFPAALAVPRLRSEYESLLRDQKVAETTLVFALERLENARANEARDVSTFLVLDPPVVPTRKSRPHRLTIILLFAAVAFAGTLIREVTRSAGGVGPLVSILRRAGGPPAATRGATPIAGPTRNVG